MASYQIQSSSLRCSRTGRALEPGEKFYSVLFDRDGTWVREDISLEAWQGPPADAFSFWLCKAPAKDQPRKVIYDDGMLLECFDRLAQEHDPAKIRFRYVLALLLVRRKRLRLVDAERVGGREVLILEDPRRRVRYRVPHPGLSEGELAEVENEVVQLLGIA